MDEKMIVVPLNLFKLDQDILVVDAKGATTFAQVELAHLPEVVVEASRVHDAEHIRLIGNGNYANALSNEIKEYALQNYSEHEIKITIMEV